MTARQITARKSRSADRRSDLFLTSRLIRAATVLGRVAAQVHKREHRLSAPEFSVLVILGSADGETVTSSHIVEATEMDKTKVSRAVSALDERGWLHRTRATSDRRFEYLALTAEGARVYAELMPKVEKAESNVLALLTAEERDGLERGLDGLDRAFGQ